MATKTLKPSGAKGRFLRYSNKESPYLPNSSKVGFSLYKVKPGDLVKFRVSDDDFMWGRVIGMITSTDSDGADGKGNILVCALGSTLSFGMEMWVDPADVVEAQHASRCAAFLDWFLNAQPDDLAGYIRDESGVCKRVFDAVNEGTKDV